jgi:hypothetical protein
VGSPGSEVCPACGSAFDGGDSTGSVASAASGSFFWGPSPQEEINASDVTINVEAINLDPSGPEEAGSREIGSP